jgi:hypothetical protein
MCIFGGVLAGAVKSPVVFPIVIIIFMFVFGYFSIIDWWICGVVIMFGALATATLLRNQMSG